MVKRGTLLSEVLMGRKPRIEFNGALYHVIQRGIMRNMFLKIMQIKTSSRQIERVQRDDGF